MLRNRRFTLLIVLVLAGLLLAACGTPAPEEEAPAEEEMAEEEMAEEEMAGLPDLGGQEVVIAVENAYPPFNFLDDSGEGVGWDYDMGRELCSRLNCDPVFTEAAWDGIFPAMAAGEFDVLFDGVTYTADRDETVDFSDPYLDYGQVLLARADEDRWSDPDSFAADDSLLIATQLGTTNEIAAEKLVGTDRIQSFEDFGLATQAVLSGDADAVMIDSVAALGFMNENPGELQILGELEADEQLAFVFPPGSELIAPWNAALAAMKDDGTLQSINDTWFSPAEAAMEEMAELPDLGGQEVVIAVENAYPPFNFLDDSGEGVGWDYDMGRELCNRLNCDPVFTEAAWDGIFPAMAAGEFDVLFDGVTYTADRDETVDFSDPYLNYGQVLLARAGEDRWTDPDSFAADDSLLIATQLGTTNEIAAEKLVGTDRIQSFEDFGLATQAVLSGDADAVMIDSVAALGFMNENPGELQILGTLEADEQLAFVFPPGSELIAPWNAALAAMKDDGTLQSINDTWFSPSE